MSAVFPANLAEIDCFKQAARSINASGTRARAILADIEAGRAEDLRDYRAALKAMPWNFEFEDDQGRWRQGVASLAALHAMQADIDPLGLIWTAHLTSIGRNLPLPRVGSGSEQAIRDIAARMGVRLPGAING